MRSAFLIIPALLASAVLTGCSPVEQPDSLRRVEVLEVPLVTSTDRAELLAILRGAETPGGLHIDDGSESWIEFVNNRKGGPPPPDSPLSKTIYVSAWRGDADKDLELFVEDGGHHGKAWVTFQRGQHPNLATEARTRLSRQIKARWPQAREIALDAAVDWPAAKSAPSGEASAPEAR